MMFEDLSADLICPVNTSGRLLTVVLSIAAAVIVTAIVAFSNTSTTSIVLTTTKAAITLDAPLLPPFPQPPPTAWSLPVTTLDGKVVDIGTQPGWRVVYFWSAECPCVSACEDFTLRPMAELYAGRVTFYAVDAGWQYDLGQPVAWLKREAVAHALPYPVYLDRTHQTAKALNAKVTPEAFIIDPSNHALFAGMPDDSRRFLKATHRKGYTQTYLSRALSEALAGKPVTEPQTAVDGCIISF